MDRQTKNDARAVLEPAVRGKTYYFILRRENNCAIIRRKSAPTPNLFYYIVKDQSTA